MVASDPPVGYSARNDQITLSAVTHGERPSVYVEPLGWPRIAARASRFTSDFSSDATTAVLEDSKFKRPGEVVRVGNRSVNRCPKPLMVLFRL